MPHVRRQLLPTRHTGQHHAVLALFVGPVGKTSDRGAQAGAIAPPVHERIEALNLLKLTRMGPPDTACYVNPQQIRYLEPNGVGTSIVLGHIPELNVVESPAEIEEALRFLGMVRVP